jgi:hypothetical protein
MAFTQADIDILDKKILSAKRRMRKDGREIENQTLSEMLKARKEMVLILTRSSLQNRRRPSYRAKTNKGIR